MNGDELRSRISTSAVMRQRFGSPGAFVRGWRIESSNVLVDPDAAQAAGRLLRDLTAQIEADSVVGIERGGIVLSRAIAVEAARDGVDLLDETWSTDRGFTSPSANRLGRRAIVVDDVVNSGRTARRAVRGVESLGVEVSAVACLIQYPKGRPIWLRNWDGPLLSAFGLRDLRLRRLATGAPTLNLRRRD